MRAREREIATYLRKKRLSAAAMEVANMEVASSEEEEIQAHKSKSEKEAGSIDGSMEAGALISEKVKVVAW